LRSKNRLCLKTWRVSRRASPRSAFVWVHIGPIPSKCPWALKGVAAMKTRKPSKANEPTLLEQLSGPLRDIVNNLKENAASELEKLRERDSAKYLEFAAKILPLVAALNPSGNEFTDAKDKHSLGVALLKSVGASELDIDDGQITDALN